MKTQKVIPNTKIRAWGEWHGKTFNVCGILSRVATVRSGAVMALILTDDGKRVWIPWSPKTTEIEIITN